MVARLVLGILTAVFLPLGLVFLVLGLVIDEPDRGSPEGFLYAGGGIALAGLALGAAFVALLRAEARRRSRRTARTTAEVLDVRFNYNVRSGGRVAARLTVRLAGREVTGTFLLPPVPPGERVDVAYEPEDPANFAPA